MNASKEKSIRRIGLYFLILGFICACLVAPTYTGLRIVVPLCVLMCAPRLMYNIKKWESVLLMISAIFTTLALLCIDGLFIMLSGTFDQMDFLSAIILGIITVTALLNCYLCYRLFNLLFETKQSELESSIQSGGVLWIPLNSKP